MTTSLTLKARAFKAGLSDSLITSGPYTISPATLSSGSTNLLTNGYIESAAWGTDSYSGTRIVTLRVTDDKHDGTYAMKSVASNYYFNVMRGGRVTGIVAGATYTVSAWFKMTGMTGSGAHTCLWWQNASGVETGYRCGTISSGTDTTAWIQKIGTVVAPPGTTQVYFDIRVETGTSGGTLWVDDVTWVKS